MFLVRRGPFHGHHRASPVLVANMRGFDLDGPTIRRDPEGSMMGPSSGGWGCPACADNVNMHSPSHDRDPQHC
eukprot:4854386-Pyramimonas_sp.AAC.1